MNQPNDLNSTAPDAILGSGDNGQTRTDYNSIITNSKKITSLQVRLADYIFLRDFYNSQIQAAEFQLAALAGKGGE